MRPKKIISGGQTGADQAGLRAAKLLGIDTGGWMPQGWRTQEGPRPEFRELYGSQEHERDDYPARTVRNIETSDATLILGDVTTPGCSLTLRTCQHLRKPVLVVPRDRDFESARRQIASWTAEIRIAVLNVAGNREILNPGIGAWSERLLIAAFGPHADDGVC